MSEQPATVGAHLDEVLQRQEAELAIMREALRREVASSDFLWDRALQRGLITEDEWVIARDPEGPWHRQEAAIVRHGAPGSPAG